VRLGGLAHRCVSVCVGVGGCGNVMDISLLSIFFSLFSFFFPRVLAWCAVCLGTGIQELATSIYVFSYEYICVLILLILLYYYACVLILLCVCPHTTMLLYVSS